MNWEMCFDDKFLFSVRQTSDNGYIVAGASINYDEENVYLWLLKLD
jgi:hypothetical protein